MQLFKQNYSQLFLEPLLIEVVAIQVSSSVVKDSIH